MTLDYSKVWNTMNELESVTAKICSAREILACAIDAQESGNANRTETLLYAVDEYLQYYLAEFDEKFKDAWRETVKKLDHKEIDDCMPPWGHSDLEYEIKYGGTVGPEITTSTHSSSYYDYTRNDPNRSNPSDKVVKWQLPIERKIENGVDDYYIQFPDDLLEAANLRAGDDVEWIDRGDGSYLIKKVTKTLESDEC